MATEVTRKQEIELRYYIKPEELKITGLCSAVFAKEIQQLQDCKELEVVIRKRKKVRSSAANRYYWGEIVNKVTYGLKMMGYRLDPELVGEIVIDMLKNCTPEQAHELLKSKFASRLFEETEKVTTTKLGSREIGEEYFEPISQWAAEELNVIINKPDETKKD